MRYTRQFGKLLNGCLTAALVAVLVCNLYVICAREFLGIAQPNVFGWSSAVVVSGSMEPAIEVGDMVIVREADAYRMGDVITFESGASIVTHRIVDETPEGYITRGDANNTDDASTVTIEQIIGKVVFTLPGIGNITQLLRTPLGMLCLVLLGFGLVWLPGRQDDPPAGKKGGKYAK